MPRLPVAPAGNWRLALTRGAAQGGQACSDKGGGLGQASFQRGRQRATTLTQSTNGDAAADPLLRHIHSLMVNEVASICAGLSPPVQLRVTAETYLAAMEGSDHKASTLQDLLAGRPFEKDALVTAVQEVARSAGVATPYIDFAGALLQGLERNAVLAKM